MELLTPAERAAKGIALVVSGGATPTDAARQVKVALSYLQKHASQRGIVLSQYYETSRPVARPFGPKGFSRTQVTWARQNYRDPEARLILGMLGEVPGRPADLAAVGVKVRA